jgi:hypothetical protein
MVGMAVFAGAEPPAATAPDVAQIAATSATRSAHCDRLGRFTPSR